MRTITKKELTDGIADALKLKRSIARTVVQRFLDAVIAELAKGNRLEFRDFGVFEVRTRKPRMAQNPRTLQRVPVPVKATVKFKVGRMMKELVQKGLAVSSGKAERQVESAAASEASPPSP